MKAELEEVSALKQAAHQREETGFITMPLAAPALRAEERDAWATANTTLVSSGGLQGSYVVAYGEELRGASIWDFDAPVRQPHLVRSDNFLVRFERNTATVGGGGDVIFADFGVAPRRGVTVVRVPRKVLFSQEVSFFTNQLKRKAPKVILAGRRRGEGDY